MHIQRKSLIEENDFWDFGDRRARRDASKQRNRKKKENTSKGAGLWDNDGDRI